MNRRIVILFSVLVITFAGFQAASLTSTPPQPTGTVTIGGIIWGD